MSLLMRNVTRTRTVPFAPYPGAPVEHFDEEYIVTVPRDWDRAVLVGVAVGTGLLLTLAVSWSTASIGALLALSGVMAVIAYGVAAVFDAAWIICMALEWLARYDPRKAVLPRRAGYAALGISMASIATEAVIITGGWKGIAVGLIGSAVSLIAKGIWTLAIRHTAKPLSPIEQQYVARRQAAAGAELAMAGIERQLERSRSHLTAYREAYARPAVVEAPKDIDRAADHARSLLPGATDDEITAQLTDAGLVMWPVIPPVTSHLRDDHRSDHSDDHSPDRTPATVSVGFQRREPVTPPVTPPPGQMTGAELLAAARRLDREARKGKPSIPVTIQTLQDELGLSRRDARDLRRNIVGEE
jgi:hypothetical protein